MWSISSQVIVFESVALMTHIKYDPLQGKRRMGAQLKWQRKLRCTRRLTKALPWPVGRDRKILTGLGTNQIVRFVTVPCQKKEINQYFYIDMQNVSLVSHGLQAHGPSSYLSLISFPCCPSCSRRQVYTKSPLCLKALRT